MATFDEMWDETPAGGTAIASATPNFDRMWNGGAAAVATEAHVSAPAAPIQMPAPAAPRPTFDQMWAEAPDTPPAQPKKYLDPHAATFFVAHANGDKQAAREHAQAAGFDVKQIPVHDDIPRDMIDFVAPDATHPAQQSQVNPNEYENAVYEMRRNNPDIRRQGQGFLHSTAANAAATFDNALIGMYGLVDPKGAQEASQGIDVLNAPPHEGAGNVVGSVAGILPAFALNPAAGAAAFGLSAGGQARMEAQGQRDQGHAVSGGREAADVALQGLLNSAGY